MTRPSGSKRRLIVSIAADLFVLAAFLLTFAYFHHVRVKDDVPVAIPTAVPTATPAATPVRETDAALGEQAEAAVDTGLLGGKYADQFTDGAIISDENQYRSANVSITVTQETTDDSTYYLADIYVKRIESFRTAVALDYKEYNADSRKNCMQVPQLAGLVDALVAISGDNYVFRNAGLLAIRNGLEWKRDLPFTDDICAMFRDGTVETFATKSAAACRAYVEELYTRGVYQVWCFGPRLLDETGGAMTKFNSSVTGKNPRAAFGYYEPGHYCFILVDGRQKGYSLGMSLPELSALFEALGCKEAYNLDGGDTVAMTFRDALINRPEEATPRAVSDILYICEPDASAGGQNS